MAGAPFFVVAFAAGAGLRASAFFLVETGAAAFAVAADLDVAFFAGAADFAVVLGAGTFLAADFTTTPFEEEDALVFAVFLLVFWGIESGFSLCQKLWQPSESAFVFQTQSQHLDSHEHLVRFFFVGSRAKLLFETRDFSMSLFSLKAIRQFLKRNQCFI